MKRRKILFSLSVFVFFLLSSTTSLSCMIVYSDQSVFYSDKLTAGTELSWTLNVLDVEPEEDIDQYGWSIKYDEFLSNGDVFKIVLSKDPDELNSTGLSGIFDTSDTWAEFFINDESIGEDATELFVSRGFSPQSGPEIIFIYILPTHFTADKAHRIIQEHLYEGYENWNLSNDTYLFEVSIDRTKFYMKYYIKYENNITDFSQELSMEVAYNIEWGVLSKMETLIKTESTLGNSSAHIVLESDNWSVRVSYDWVIGIISMLISCLVVLSIRKRRRE